MIRLYDNETDRHVGDITEAQLQVLIDHLEETSGSDRDYYIDGPTLDHLEDAGADAALLELLRRGLGAREGYEVRWERG